MSTEESTTVASDWREVIPKEVKEWDEFKNSDTPEKFFDQMSHMRSMMGKSIRVPSEEAGEETWNEFYGKLESKAPDLMRKPNIDDDAAMEQTYRSLGKPDTPAKYDLPEFDDFEIPESRASQLKEYAHKANLTKKQFKALASDLLGFDKQIVDKTTDQVNQARAALSDEWGDAFEQRFSLAQKMAESSGAPESLMTAIKEKKIDADTMRWLFNMSKQMTVEGRPMATVDDLVEAPADIQGRIDDMMNNQAHPYWDSSHPQHKKAVDTMIQLRRKLVA